MNNLKNMTHFFDKISSDHIRQKFLKYGMFFILKTIQSCSQAVAEKLQHATVVSEQQREKYLILSFKTYKIL